MKAIPGLTKTERNSRLLSAERKLGLRMTCKVMLYSEPSH